MEDIERFIRGFCRFQQHYLRDRAWSDSLRAGQQPGTLLIGCCDSRVDPALLTGSDPGELFVVRNVANLVPPCDPTSYHGASAAIEFAVCGLDVARVIVLGHRHCGGIRSLLSPSPLCEETDFLGNWLRVAEPVRKQVVHELGHKTMEQQAHACEMASILHSLDNLMTYPWIRRRVEAGDLALHGWYFDIDTGALLAYSFEKQEFRPLVRAVSTYQATPSPRGDAKADREA